MADIKIYTTSEWGAKAPRRTNFEQNSARGIIVHNTEHENRAPLTGDAEKRAAFLLARNIQEDHLNRVENGVKWSDSGQNFTISRGGIVMEGRHGSLSAARNGKVIRGAHANNANYNRTWFGIELEGHYVREYRMTSQQWQALIDLCAWLSIWGNFDASNIKGHMDVSDTDCPGLLINHLDELRREVARRKTEVINEIN